MFDLPLSEQTQFESQLLQFSQLAANVLGKAMVDDPSPWTPAIHVGDQNES